MTSMTPFPSDRSHAMAKWAFTTRRVRRQDVHGVAPLSSEAQSGDLLLCRIRAVNQHRRIQLASGRHSEGYPGDQVVLCLGDRYAPDQFMGRAAIAADSMDLLAGGGVAGLVEAAHRRMSRPTELEPLGLLTDRQGQVINIASYALPTMTAPSDITVLGVFGASMNGGKTTAAVSLAHGLQAAGLRVAGIKATGTGAFGDYNAFADASIAVSDFTDAGMASTYRMPLERIEKGFATLVGHAAREGAQVAVVEIADGVLQQETAAILNGSSIVQRLDGMLFAAPDALSAVGGINVLAQSGHRPFALSGMLSLSALGAREAESATGLPVLTREQLWAPETIMPLVQGYLRKSSAVTGTAAA
ncbi:hypothetical protein [Halomonas huangheensis]|uniref:DUF1611 domain-containing protein n=1 Tax=Halomonas huangheensis TaxID=1178482 RepID=W1N2L7_9GAMM|nr:hypothetical protein [Halomonas huangheensis]ALM51319.1 hypothetical protein AR456_02670 [Halomonas huangheensis]ERL49748.1 hypothetical protein BJB45_01115 [Halomonas huangheensis]